MQTAQLDTLLDIYRQAQEQLRGATRSMHHVSQVANDTYHRIMRLQQAMAETWEEMERL